MKPWCVDRRYIYLREKGHCYYCNKAIHYGEMSLDHYLPKCKGGPSELHNLVCSCKQCNTEKKNMVPEDWMEVWKVFFEQALQNKKLILGTQGMKYSDVEGYIGEITNIWFENGVTIFSNGQVSFCVAENRVTKKQKGNMK